MAQWVTIWRAAQLVEVPRGVLQQRVRLGEIELTDGLVSTEALLALYPQAKLELSGMAERVAQIRDESCGRRVRERLLPRAHPRARQSNSSRVRPSISQRNISQVTMCSSCGTRTSAVSST